MSKVFDYTMSIADEHKWRYIFHFTDIHNLDSIIKNGLLCTNVKNDKGIRHRNIANMTIQERRANMDVPVSPGGKVHDYVPFYFSSVNPMLLRKLNDKNVDQQDLIYLCVKIQRLDGGDAVFTDASANTITPPAFYKDVQDLDKLDWRVIDDKKWGVGSDEYRHKKMAEALIHNMVDISEIDAILVFNESVKNDVKRVFEENNVKSPAIIFDGDVRLKNYHFYYTKFFIATQQYDSLVTGPATLLSYYKRLLKNIKKQRQKLNKSYPHKTLKELIEALEEDFDVIPELKNVEDLLQDYPSHNDTVGDHTRGVVAEMKKQVYYNKALDEKKNILLLSAYLHDIGKGPKNKWKEGIMNRAYPDHPADAVPMLLRILTEEIETLTDEEIRQVCMLVIYHDIVGDCMMKGREKQQILDIIESEDDLDMLFAISVADAKAVKEDWGIEILNKMKSFKEEIIEMKQS